MRIVTVARKPCASSSTTANVVEHQAGALNIDAARVGFASSEDRDAAFPGGKVTSRKVTGGGLGAGWKPHERAVFEAGRRTDGRWPANLILVHPGCKIVGERKVPTGTAVRHRGGGKTIFSETDKPPMEDIGYADADGNETIPQWACEEGCPVADLDRQSGSLKSGSGTVKRSSGADRAGNRGPAFGGESRPDGTPQIWYGDQGGASRFFKQFQGRDHRPDQPSTAQGPMAPRLETGLSQQRKTQDMSITEMYAVDRDGDVVPFARFQNSHGSAMAVWNLLAERYCGEVPFFAMMRDGLTELFDAARDGELEPWETVTLMTTCDNVLISIEHVESVASAFEEFAKHHGPRQEEKQHVFSIGDQARELRRMLEEREEKGWRGVCWNQTSVNGDALWYGVTEEDEEEDEDERRPYNIDKDSRHWVWPEAKKADVE